MPHLAMPDLELSVGSRRTSDAGVKRALASTGRNGTSGSEGVAVEHVKVTRRFLVKGTGSGSLAAVRSPPLQFDLTRRSMTDE